MIETQPLQQTVQQVTSPTSIAALCGVIALVIKAWQSERRQQREAEERREDHRREADERRAEAERASKERRRTHRALRNLRPDSYCADRGCPLATKDGNDSHRKLQAVA